MSSSSSSSPAPVRIRSIRADRILELAWPDGLEVRLPFRFLRARCSCAACVNEFTGERMVDVDDIPAGIEIEGAELAGHYALRITWNDRHSSGLYTWDALRRLSDAREWETLPGIVF